MRLKNKTAIVTGSAQGIGKAIAVRLAGEGARVLMVDRNIDRLEEAVAEVRRLGHVAELCAADISVAAEAARIVRHAMKKLGAIHILVNNAGVAQVQSFLELSEREWDAVLDVNLKGTFLVSQQAAREMVRQRFGVILNMASTNALVSEPGLAHYSASKAGIVSLTKSMALELAATGIRVNAVCPGWVETELSASAGQTSEFVAASVARVPLGRKASPDEIAAVFAFLASDDASFITGEAIVVDGGQLAQ